MRELWYLIIELLFNIVLRVVDEDFIVLMTVAFEVTRSTEYVKLAGE